MSIQHFYSQTVADGTATSVVRPSDWNSAHQQVLNLGGNTLGTSQVNGADIVWAGGNGVTLSAAGSTVSVGIGTLAQSTHVHNFATTTTNGASIVVGTANSAGATIGVPVFLTTASPVNHAHAFDTTTTNGAVPVVGTSNSAGVTLAFPPFLTTAANSTHIHGFATTTTNGAVAIVGTNNSAGVTLAMPAWITTYVAQTTQTQPAGNIAGVGTTFAGTNITATMGNNSNGLALSLSVAAPGGGGGAALQGSGTYTQNTGTVQFANSNGITFGLSNNGVMSASFSQTADTNKAGLGTTFAGTNVTATMAMGSNGLGLSLSAPTPGGGGAINVAAGTTNGNVQTLSFVNSNGVSFGLNGSTITASAAAGGGAAFTGFWFQPEVFGNTMTSTHAPATVYIRPFELGGYVDADKIIFQQSMASSISTGAVTASVSAGNASSGTGTWGLTGTVVMFSRVNTNETNASYNSIVSFASDSYSMSAGYSSSVSWSTNVSSCTASWTTSGAVGFIKNIDAAGNFTTSSSGTSGSSTFSSTSTNANSFSSTYIMSFPYAHMSGVRPLFVPGGVDFVPGEYWIGHQHNTQSGSTNDSRIARNAVMQPSMLYFTISTNNYMEIGNSVAMTTSNFRAGFGSHSASSLTTGNMALSQVSLMASNASLYFALDGKTL